MSPKRKYGRIILLLTLIALAIGAMMNQTSKNTLLKRSKYTVGVTNGTSDMGHTGQYVHFYFEANGEKYDSKRSLHGTIKTEGANFLVVYDSLNPNLNTLILNYPLPDTMKVGQKISKVSKKDIQLNSWNYP